MQHRFINSEISEELSEKEQKMIASLHEWRESAQLPVLTEKMMVLSKRIKEMDETTSRFSSVLLLLTIIQVALAVLPYLKG